MEYFFLVSSRDGGLKKQQQQIFQIMSIKIAMPIGKSKDKSNLLQIN
jgi:hypothetical protein